jgi:hypothetical protein
VGLVDHHQRRPGRDHLLERLRPGQLLGGQEQELEVAGGEVLDGLAALAGRDGRVGLPGPGQVAPGDGLDLVALEGDQGRHHHRGPGDPQGGQLVDGRLARPGGQHGQHVAAVEQGPHGLALARAEPPEAEGRAGQGEDRVAGHGRR